MWDLSKMARHVAALRLSLEEFCKKHRETFGIDGCECPKLIAAEKLLEELKRESKN